MQLIFGGVDGTGVWNNGEYDHTFETSHVRVLYNSWGHGPHNYERGPTTEDWRLDRATRVSAQRTYNHVIANWKSGRSDQAVFLAGYSRGGAAVIEVSKWLKADKIPVECLILFDPVDRTGQVGLPWRDTPIASTVGTVIYAKRSRSSMSRESFGNCGLTMENGQATPFKEFPRTTHGGMGGVPWTKAHFSGLIDEGPPDGLTAVTVAEDRAGANAVQQWSFDLIETAISNFRNRFSKPDDPRKNPRVYPGQPGIGQPGNGRPGIGYPGNGQKIHVVKAGDWLSKIAITYYGDMNKWKVIYDHPQNRQTIGPNPDLIQPGQKLVIP